MYRVAGLQFKGIFSGAKAHASGNRGGRPRALARAVALPRNAPDNPDSRIRCAEVRGDPRRASVTRAALAYANVRARTVSTSPECDVKDVRQTNPAPTDGELVRRVLDGSRPAFDELIERHQRRAASVAYRLLGSMHDALEVCQDAFIRAYQRLDSLKEPERFGPWLLKTTTNLALNFRRARRPRVSLDDCLIDDASSPAERLSDAAWSEDRPGAGLAAEELGEKLNAAMSRLTPAQRTALVLFSIEQMPQKDVAEILDCSVEAVKWHVFQARKKLKEELVDFL